MLKKKTYQLGGMWNAIIAVKGGKEGRREQGDMTLFSSDGDEKLTIIVSMVVIELKNGVCAVFRVRCHWRKIRKLNGKTILFNFYYYFLLEYLIFIKYNFFCYFNIIQIIIVKFS